MCTHILVYHLASPTGKFNNSMITQGMLCASLTTCSVVFLVSGWQMIQLQIPSQWLLSYTASSFKNWVTWEIETELLQIGVKKCLSLLRELQNHY